MRPAKCTSAIIIIAMVLSLALSGGCAGMKGSEIYGNALFGALVGGIIGYQSDEATAGALTGAAIFGVGEFLHQADKLTEKEAREKKSSDECKENVFVDVHNSNGSVTPVQLKKKGDLYIGPKGERYEQLPTEEQLKPIYGM